MSHVAYTQRCRAAYPSLGSYRTELRPVSITMELVAARVSTGSELEDASASLPNSRTVPYGSPEHRAKRSRCELC